MTPKRYALNMKHELSIRGLSDMEMNLRFYNDGWLSVDIWDCGQSDFTLLSGYPTGQDFKPKEVAEDSYQTFLEYRR